MPGKKRKKERKTKTAELMAGCQVQSPAEEAVEVPGMTIGFVGKAKGLKDVLFERWLLNPANLKSYTNHGTRGGRAAWWASRRAS